MSAIGNLVSTLDNDRSPKLTWYGADAERIELSGHVLSNWAIKTSNLFAEEDLVGAGTNTILDMPVHWRTVVIGLGIWLRGGFITPGHSEATVTIEQSTLSATNVITTRPPAWNDFPGSLVAVALPSLSRGFTGQLRPDHLDYAATVSAMSDALESPDGMNAVSPAIFMDGQALSFDALGLDFSTHTSESTKRLTAPRILIQTDDIARSLVDCVAIWLHGSSVVLSTTSTQLSDHTLSTEGVTRDYYPEYLASSPSHRAD